MSANINATIEDLVDAINAAVACCAANSETGPQAADDSGLSSADVQIGIDEQFDTSAAYYVAKCNVANAIYDTVKQGIDWLVDNNTDLLAGVYGAVTAGVLAHVLIGPIGWAAAAIELSVIEISIYLISRTVNFTDLQTVLAAQHAPLVTSLFNAGTATGARAAVKSILEAATGPSLSPIEVGLINIMLPFKLLNQLFSPTPQTAAYQSPSPISCGTPIQIWDFASSGQGWTFRDDSENDNSATGEWQAGGEWWQMEITTTAGNSGRAKGTIYLTGLSIAVSSGNSVQFDFGPTSDGVNASLHIHVVYSDMTTQDVLLPSFPSAGTVILDVAAAKTLAEIECSVSRAWAVASTFTREIQTVRVQ